MKLYYNPRSRASISKWILDELGVDYDLVMVDLEKGEHKSPAFREINPAGKLPALLDGEQRLFESVAIGIYLGDKYPEAGLAPSIDSPQRGRYLSLMVYATSQLEPAMGDTFLKMESSPTRGWTDFETVQKVLIQELAGKPYLLGDSFSLADILIGSNFIWRRLFGQTEEPPEIKTYIDRLLQRPHALKMA